MSEIAAIRSNSGSVDEEIGSLPYPAFQSNDFGSSPEGRWSRREDRDNGVYSDNQDVGKKALDIDSFEGFPSGIFLENVVIGTDRFYRIAFFFFSFYRRSSIWKTVRNLRSALKMKDTFPNHDLDMFDWITVNELETLTELLDVIRYR